MKNVVLLIVLLHLFFSSCSKSYIDLAPISNMNGTSFFKTEADIKIAVNGAYNMLQLSGLYGNKLPVVIEARSGNTTNSEMRGEPNQEDIILYVETTDNSNVKQIWTDSYKAIMTYNTVLGRIDPLNNIETTKKNIYIGQLKFLRALAYFNLVRLFGDVPLVLKEITAPEESFTYKRESVSDVYKQIIKDLGDAEQLPISYSSADVGRATSGAAKTLLAQVYLTQKDFSSAKNKLKEVIDLGIYGLLTNYGYLWDLKHENSNESIFEVQFKKGGTGTGSAFANLAAPTFSSPYTVSVGRASGNICPTQDMENEYETGDLRKNLSMVPGYFGKGGIWVEAKWCIKYKDVPFVASDCDNNWPLMRYADALLMYAEVLNELGYVPDGEAFTYLNTIRSRAGLQPKTSSNADIKLRVQNQDEFRNAVYHERRTELAFEGHQYYDLIRTGRLLETMRKFYFGSSVQDHQILFAIPQVEIDKNPDMIWQNPGYPQ